MMQPPWFLGNSRGLDLWPLGIIVLALWSVVWTGLALWHAARRADKGWFVVFLLVHTGGILELIYLLGVAKIQGSKPTPTRRKRTK